MSGRIFINYRRGDEPGFTQALLGRLEQAFLADRIFIDVDNIPPGDDFVRALDSQVAECDTLLAVIGKGWLDSKDERGNRRLDDPNDFVRIEIESALRQGKRVIPVLVHEARMPHPNELPEAIRPLATRNAIRLTHERFRADVQGLIKALQGGPEHGASPRARKFGRNDQGPGPYKPWQSLRWTPLTVAVLGVLLASVAGVWLAIPHLFLTHQEAALVPSTPMPRTAIGVWRWFNPDGSDVHIQSDGTTIHLLNGKQTDAGNWVLLNAEGTIRITWNTGWWDQWQVSADGHSMAGTNQNGPLPTVYRK